MTKVALVLMDTLIYMNDQLLSTHMFLIIFKKMKS
jgi:hypothetical protein